MSAIVGTKQSLQYFDSLQGVIQVTIRSALAAYSIIGSLVVLESHGTEVEKNGVDFVEERSK